jgi:hypothetical protein
MDDATPEEAARDRRAGRANLCRRTLREDASAVNPGTGTEVNQVIRAGHELIVMLDHKDGVSLVAQALQSRDQALVVAGVKPNARFIEDIKHPGEIRSELSGESNPLGLAAGERVRRAVESEVPQAYLVEKPQSLANGGHDVLENQAAARIEFDAAQAADQPGGGLGEQLWE